MHRPPLSSLPPLPAASAWLLVRALFKRPSRSSRSSSNAISGSYRLDRIDADHVRRYSEAFGFPAGPVPLTYLYLLAQRAQLATMLDCAIPFRLPGLIHVENTLTLHGDVHPAQPLAITTKVALPLPSSDGALRCVLETSAFDGQRLVFSCQSTYLIRRGKRAARNPAPATTDTPAPVLGQWPVPADAGRRYARLSGDWNPIHLWAWSARLMGLHHPIIHGMHTVAKACALYQQAAGIAPTSLHCRFKKPIPLRSKVALTGLIGQGRFSVILQDCVAVEGTIR